MVSAGACFPLAQSVFTKHILARIISRLNELRISSANFFFAWNLPINSILLDVNSHIMELGLQEEIDLQGSGCLTLNCQYNRE